MTDYPKISVVTITYCHEHYIIQTLSSILMQNYLGEIEFIIANDNSPDNTNELIENFISTHNIPSNFIIKYTKHVKNKGMSRNFNWALQQASGKYIAICEGDDYWTSADKLQKQVDFLEANEKYVLCFTNMDILKNNIMQRSKPLHDKNSFNKSEIPYSRVPTLTVLFRNVVKDLPTPLYNSLIDASLFLFLSQYGSFYYFNKAMVVYRIHTGGVWSGSSDLVNYKRSTNVRLLAWHYLKNIDKLSLAEVLIKWITLKKNAERSKGMLISYSWSLCLEYYFTLYIYMHKSKKD